MPRPRFEPVSAHRQPVSARSRSKFRILKNHRAETRAGNLGLQREMPDIPRQGPDFWRLTSGNVGTSVNTRNPQRETPASWRRASSRPPSKVGCHAGLAPRACSTRRSRGRADTRRSGSRTDGRIPGGCARPAGPVHGKGKLSQAAIGRAEPCRAGRSRMLGLTSQNMSRRIFRLTARCQ